MGQYFGRSLRYMLKLVILIAVIYSLMFVTGMSGFSADMFFNELFCSKRGLALLIALVALGFAYPKYGFVKRDVNAGAQTDREHILKAFHLNGYTLVSQSSGVMVFRASGLSKRLLDAFDDKIVLTYDDDKRITLDGIRKEVVQVAFRLNSYVENKTAEDDER